MPNYVFTSCEPDHGGVFTLDSTTGRSRRLLEEPCRGLTRGPDGAYYAVSGSRAGTPSAIIFRVDPASGSVSRVAEHAFKGAHDLRWIDGHFYLVCSWGNRVVRLDERAQVVDQMQIVKSDSDVCHANCLVAMDGALYLSVFTLSEGAREDKRTSRAWTSEGKILRLDYAARTFDVAYEPLAQPHSLVPYAGRIYLTESHAGRVTEVDLAGGTSRPVAELRGFARGIAVGPDEALVGCCRIRRSNAHTLPLLQRLRDEWFPFTGFVLFDPKTWRPRRRIRLPGAGIYEIHRVD